MVDLSVAFIISQVLVCIAIVTDFISFQYKERKYTFAFLTVSSALISTHFFLLGKTMAGIVVMLSIAVFITCSFTTNKKYLYLFLLINAVITYFTFQDGWDIVYFIGITIFFIGNFQENNRHMRLIMMGGITFIIAYNWIIFSPMGVVLETIFLFSNIAGYYKHYIRKSKDQKKVGNSMKSKK